MRSIQGSRPEFSGRGSPPSGAAAERKRGRFLIQDYMSIP